MNAALNPVQKYMLRLVLFGAGKTIRHKGAVCEVLEKHHHIRRLMPLVDGANPFWVALRPVDKKRLKNERTHRQYASGIRSVFRNPQWMGESRPDRESVSLESNVLTVREAQRLVRDFGFDAHAAFTSVSHFASSKKQPDRARWEGNRKPIAQPIPYVPAAFSRRTKTGGGFNRDSVLKAVAGMRTSHQMRMAVFEVVFRRRFPSQIAGKFGVGVRALNKAASRIRKSIRGSAPNASENAASDAVVGIPCT